MHRAGGQFLAGPTLTNQQDRGIGRRNLADQVTHGLHRRRITHQVVDLG